MKVVNINDVVDVGIYVILILCALNLLVWFDLNFMCNRQLQTKVKFTQQLCKSLIPIQNFITFSSVVLEMKLADTCRYYLLIVCSL
jgi:hypothetical protein